MAVKTTMPAIEPRMSSRYAASGLNDANWRATPSAIVAMTVAERRNTIGRASQTGRPVAPGLWK